MCVAALQLLPSGRAFLQSQRLEKRAHLKLVTVQIFNNSKRSDTNITDTQRAPFLSHRQPDRNTFLERSS